jgi:hypothetical protein
MPFKIWPVVRRAALISQMRLCVAMCYIRFIPAVKQPTAPRCAS